VQSDCSDQSKIYVTITRRRKPRPHSVASHATVAPKGHDGKKPPAEFWRPARVCRRPRVSLWSRGRELLRDRRSDWRRGTMAAMGCLVGGDRI